MYATSSAESPAFPIHLRSSVSSDTYRPRIEDGMSYRQWLVGHIAAGLAANPSHSISQVAAMSIELADEIIRRLDTESPVNS